MTRLICALLALLFSHASFAVVMINGVAFTATTDEQINILWEPGPFCLSRAAAQACEWNWELLELPFNRVIMKGSTGNFTASFKLPRSGLYGFRVKTCVNPHCSGWAFSVQSEDGVVNGADQGWTLYGYPAPPGDIGFE